MIEIIKKAFAKGQKQKGIYILLGITVLLTGFVIGAAVFYGGRAGETSPIIPTPTPVTLERETSIEQRVAPTQKSIIYETTQDEIDDLPTLESSTPEADGSVINTFESPYISRKNMVLTQNGQAVFERVIVPERSEDPGFLRVSEFLKTYGQPQEIAEDSKFYGPFIETFIYAEYGFTLIGNSTTDEVFEVHVYPPTTVENYIEMYGDDIDEDHEHVL